MDKKAKTKKKGGKRKGSSSSKSGQINTSQLIGIAAGIFAAKKGLPQLTFYTNLSPDMQAGAKILAGMFLPKQDFVKKTITDQSMLDGAGTSLMTLGIMELMVNHGMAGDKMGALKDDDVLAIALQGIQDISTVNADVLGEDISSVNADVLGNNYNDDVIG